MLKIAICDDERVEVEYLSRLVADWGKRRLLPVQISRFSSAEQFLFSYAENKEFDLLLLDVQMDRMNGVELAKRIRAENKRVQLIFITGIPDFISEGYEVSALHYLLKPVSEEKLFSVLDKAGALLNQTEPLFLLQLDGEMIALQQREILYLEARGHYLTIHTKRGEYQKKMTLTDALSSLDERFYRCQRSFAVNLYEIKRVSRTEVELLNGEKLPLSRNLYDEIHRAIIRLYP